MARLFVNVTHLIPPDKSSIYTKEKRSYKIFLFNRKEYYTDKKDATKRLAKINKELTSLCFQLSEITAEIYTLYRMDYFTLDARKKERLRISLIDFDKSFNAIEFRSQWPEGGFLAFMIFFNCSDILLNVLDDLYANQRTAYFRRKNRIVKQSLETVIKQAKYLNGTETTN